MEGVTLKRELTRWLVLQRIGKKPTTRHYLWEVVRSIRAAWRPALLKPVSEINVEDVTRFALAAQHFSATRWNAMVAVLHAIVPAASRLKRRKVECPELRLLTREEFARLLAECERLPRSKAGLVVNFLAHTGMRITEARRLAWSNVFPDRIEAPATTAKNGKPRSIPLVNGATAALDALRAVTAGSGLVLPPGSIRLGLTKACARAGLPRLTHRHFRHLFATRCIESGVDLPTVARWLGHQDRGALLAKRYFHLLDEHSRRMAEKVRI